MRARYFSPQEAIQLAEREQQVQSATAASTKLSVRTRYFKTRHERAKTAVA